MLLFDLLEIFAKKFEFFENSKFFRLHLSFSQFKV
jgi:hypothetical protein